MEAVRTRKKLEADVTELETALEHANAANMETQKNIKKLQLNLREVQVGNPLKRCTVVMSMFVLSK